MKIGIPYQGNPDGYAHDAARVSREDAKPRRQPGHLLLYRRDLASPDGAFQRPQGSLASGSLSAAWRDVSESLAQSWCRQARFWRKRRCRNRSHESASADRWRSRSTHRGRPSDTTGIRTFAAGGSSRGRWMRPWIGRNIRPGGRHSRPNPPPDELCMAIFYHHGIGRAIGPRLIPASGEFSSALRHSSDGGRLNAVLAPSRQDAGGDVEEFKGCSVEALQDCSITALERRESAAATHQRSNAPAV